MRAGAYVKERSESGGGGGAVRAVKSQGGGAVAQWRKRACEWEGLLGRRASMGPTHFGLGVGWPLKL